MSDAAPDPTPGQEPAPHAAPEPAASGELAHAQAQAQTLELPWRRLHPLSPLLRGGIAVIVIAGILIANLRDRLIDLFVAARLGAQANGEGGDFIDLFAYLAEEHLLIWALLGLLLILAAIIGISWMSWHFSSFRITGEAVEAKRGVLFRQHRRAPLDRIQSVNLQRSLLARIVGLTQVEVQTAGQGGKVELQYLGHRDAKQVREQILLAAAVSKGQSLGAHGDTAAAEGAATHAIAVDFGGQPYAAGATMLDARLQDIADFDIDPAARETGSLIKVPFGRLLGSILLGPEMLFVPLALIALIITSIWAGSLVPLAGMLPAILAVVGILIAQFNKGFNFTLSRSADGVRVGAGLTSTTTETIPFGRVHAVEARQPLGWRPFGWWKMRITTAGYSASEAGQNKLQNVVLPVGTIDDVLRVFETLLYSDETGAQDRAAQLREALVGQPAGFLGAGPRAGWVLWFGRKRAGLRIEHALDEHASVRIRRGALTRCLVIMPVLRAQSVQLHRPLVHRMLGLATLTAHTVLGPVRVQMRGLGLVDARLAFDVLSGIVVQVQGGEATRRAEAASHRIEAARHAEAASPHAESAGGAAE